MYVNYRRIWELLIFCAIRIRGTHRRRSYLDSCIETYGGLMRPRKYYCKHSYSPMFNSVSCFLTSFRLNEVGFCNLLECLFLLISFFLFNVFFQEIMSELKWYGFNIFRKVSGLDDECLCK